MCSRKVMTFFGTEDLHFLKNYLLDILGLFNLIKLGLVLTMKESRLANALKWSLANFTSLYSWEQINFRFSFELKKHRQWCHPGSVCSTSFLLWHRNSKEEPQKIKNWAIDMMQQFYFGNTSRGNKNTYQKDVCTSMFSAALFTIAKT